MLDVPAALCASPRRLAALPRCFDGGRPFVAVFQSTCAKRVVYKPPARRIGDDLVDSRRSGSFVPALRPRRRRSRLRVQRHSAMPKRCWMR